LRDDPRRESRPPQVAATPAAASAPGPGASVTPRPTPASCPHPGAWADEITAAGQLAWQDSLPAGAGGLGITVTPLAAGPYAVFTQANAVYAIARAAGRQRWHRAAR